MRTEPRFGLGARCGLKRSLAHLAVLLATSFLLAKPGYSLVLGFDDIGGSFYDLYSGHTEQGFGVSPSYGNWHKYIDTRNGSPYRAIFAGPLNDVQPCGLVIRRTDGGLFRIRSVYMYGGAWWWIKGSRNGEEIFADKRPMYVSGRVYQIPQSAQVDAITLDFEAINFPDYLLFDDITVEPVPEPSTLAAIGGGILCVTGRRRKRSWNGIAPINADVDGDLSVNISDYGIIGDNFDQAGDLSPW